MTPPSPLAHLVPVESLESPYHEVPHENKSRAYVFIEENDLLELRSYFPRKGVLDSILAHLFRGFLLHVNSLGLKAQANAFHKNEQILLTLLNQYVPGTKDSRIKFTIDEAGNVTPELRTPRVVQ